MRATAAAQVFARRHVWTEPERRLLNHLLAYPRVLEAVERDTDPSALAGFLFEGVKEFSRFYHECPVLRAEPGLREARLALALAADRVFRHGLREAMADEERGHSPGSHRS